MRGTLPSTRGSPNGKTRRPVEGRRPRAEHIGPGEATGGTETSKYPEEEKSNEIPRVVASERGRGQTGPSASRAGVVGPPIVRLQSHVGAERAGKRGRRGLEPRTRTTWPARWFPSTAGHVKPGGKQGGPPSKPKYSPVTDSAPVPRGKGEKHPGRGVKQYLIPPAYKQSEHALGRVTACLL